MIGGTKDKVCIDAAFPSRHEDALEPHGYKKQWKPKRAFNSSCGGGGYKNGDKEEEVIKRKVCQRKRIL